MTKWIYTFFIYPLLFLGFWILSLANEKVRAGFSLRKKGAWLKPTSSEDRWLWFHVASGELEYAKPVIGELKKPGRLPEGTKILVTYFSPSVLPSLQKTKEIDLFVPMPWDTPWHWRSFLKHYRPQVLAIARTDTWPNMVWESCRAKIPSILFSATLPSHSGRYASFWGRLFYGQVVEGLTEVSCVTEEDSDHFLRLAGDLKLSVDGDTRFDQVIARVEENRPVHAAVEKLTPALVAGSTWPEDEKELLPALKNPVAKGLKVIIAPHEPTPSHLTSLEENLRALGIKSCRYSQISPKIEASIEASVMSASDAGSSMAPVVIVDQVGILADLYRIAQVAFVGGSFKKSIHSVMEPAASGCLTFMGPHHTNNREAAILKGQGFAREVSGRGEIEALLMAELKLTSAEVEDRRRQIKNVVQKNKGVSEKIALWIETHLDGGL